MKMMPPRSFVQLVLQCVSRLVCTGALAWFGCIVAGNLLTMKSSEKTRELPIATPISTNWLPTTDGFWTFTGSDFATQRTLCNENELAQKLDDLRRLEPLATAPRCEATRLVELANAQGAVPMDCPAGVCWTLEAKDLRLRLLTTRTTPPQLIGGLAALRDSNGWAVTVLKPRAPTANHLLPLAPRCESICSRRSESGQLQFELLQTDRPGDELLEHWRASGWSIQPIPWGAAGSFHFLCRRDQAEVYVWSGSSDGSRTLMLSSTVHLETETSLENTQ